MKSMCLLCGSGLNSIFSFIAGQQAEWSCLCPARSIESRVLHGFRVSHRCPKSVRISISFLSCSWKNFGLFAAYHSHRETFISCVIEECRFCSCSAGTALVQMFHKDFRDPLFSSVCVFWLSVCWAKCSEHGLVLQRCQLLLYLVYLQNVVGFCFSFFIFFCVCDCILEHH